ncbi:putative ubiquinol-cytochrome C reductase complex 14kD subunit [Ilyonectria sp. MPI-CAGE-AT-0026]|nr:putative ubiquinol-cytochrome C reductase complex 14kD subunit [Ilyonectria sp. MPI-CAGE-AT-0026]
MAISLAPFILRRPWLTKLLMPVATWYVNASGYRQLGLRYDDLVEEESRAAQIALKRLSPKESYERIYRIRRAISADVLYLRGILDPVDAELAERAALDSIEVAKVTNAKKLSDKNGVGA